MSSDNSSEILSSAAIHLGPTWRGNGAGSFQPPKPNSIDDDIESADAPNVDEKSARPMITVRHSKSELLSFRPANTFPPSELESTHEITNNMISIDPLYPICEDEPLSLEEITRLWNLGGRGGSAGRGRGTHKKWNQENNNKFDSYGNRKNLGNSESKPEDLWDDPDMSNFEDALQAPATLNLAGMAEQSEKFKLEMEKMAEGLRNVKVSKEKSEEKESFSVPSIEIENESENSGQNTTQVHSEDKRRDLFSALGLVEHSNEEHKTETNLEKIPVHLQPPKIELKAEKKCESHPTTASASIEPWFYLDTYGIKQGPFSSIDMRKWLDAGYFNENLPVCHGNGENFVSLSKLFPIPSHAFIEGVKAEIERIRAEQILQEKEKEFARKKEEEAFLERLRIEKEKADQMEKEALKIKRENEERVRIQAMQREEMRKEKLREEQLRQERARLEMINQEKLRAEQKMLEKLKQEQIKQEEIRKKLAKQEQLRQEQLREDQLRKEKARQEKLRQEYLLQEKIKKEQIQQEKIRHEQLQKAQLRKEELLKQKRMALEKAALEEESRLKAVAEENLQANATAATNPWSKVGKKESNPSLSEIQEQEKKNLKKSHNSKTSQKTEKIEGENIPPEMVDEGVKLAPKELIVPITINPALNKNLSSKERKALGRKMKAEANQVVVAKESFQMEIGPWAKPNVNVKAKSFEEIQREEKEMALKRKKMMDNQLKMVLGVTSTSNTVWSSQMYESSPSSKVASSEEKARKPSKEVSVPKKELIIRQTSVKQVEDDFWGGSAENNSASEKNKKNKSKSANEANQASARSNFGGMGMPPDMANWAKSELKQLGGSQDITLLDFCMSVADASEVREVLAAYLGSTPKVSSFASNFLSRKAAAKKNVGKGTKGGNDENQVQASAKKKRSKK
mmetsp:Transcript_7748/g.11686  ORF Transcript_7748/g.11686 Transcript_7748/m.11686 type:complete len:912 (+) Transcript_7748:77-2812(+)|eukprot:CAMPEP_0171456844 /NCGR_PEP_ID=MMETSP0945-20130129/3163_1 /TAXON_ID=109269 /ORGANISM="Vaucheria litorea, Strain CCMP2940" /LENGTH=911 /DNA_ID=CAMNT_0011982339 /DNA_START=61 /DNA_END=2796 /DNA_ORIENTATION=+